jgi:hypothetical protein
VNDIDLSVLDQAETWTDALGIEHRIADMEARYCRNVIAFLQRRADEITLVVGLSLCNVRLPDEATQAYLSVTAGIDAEIERMSADPVAWLNTKPLIKALQRRADKGD